MNVSTNLKSCIRPAREPRVTLNCDGVITESDGCAIDVTIVDVSQTGFRVRSVAELEIGSSVSLRMSEARPVRAEIRWICGHEAGGVFLDPISL
jgi:hypothetical protein